MRGGSFMSEKIVIYENPFRLKYGKLVNVGGDLLSEFFDAFSPIVGIPFPEDRMVIGRAGIGWVLVLDRGYDYTAPVSVIEDQFFVSDEILRLSEYRGVDFKFLIDAVGKLLKVVSNAIFITFNAEKREVGQVVEASNNFSYLLEIGNGKIAVSPVTFAAVEASLERIEEFTENGYTIKEIDGKYDVLYRYGEMSWPEKEVDEDLESLFSQNSKELGEPFKITKRIHGSDLDESQLEAICMLGSSLLDSGMDFGCVVAFKSVIGWSLREGNAGFRRSVLAKYGNVWVSGYADVGNLSDVNGFASSIYSSLMAIEKAISGVVMVKLYPEYSNRQNNQRSGVEIGIGTVNSTYDISNPRYVKFMYDKEYLYAKMLIPYKSLDKAKEDITKSIRWVCKKLGSDLPAGTVSFRKISSIERCECWEVGVKFDSMKSINLFHMAWVRKPTPMRNGDYWEWGSIRRFGDDYLLVGKFEVIRTENV